MPSTILGPDGRPFARAKPDSQQIGFTGITRFRGLIAEEYVPALGGAKKIEVYTKMRADGMVQAILTALTLPVIAATWVVEPKSQDAKAIRAADIVREQLMERLGECWESEVRKVLSYLQYGFSACAKNWIIDGGEVVLDELRPLHPKTILAGGKNWDLDAGNRLLGLWQYGTDGQKWREEYIPASRLLHLSNEPEFNNPEGRSVLRSGYKHWLIKDTLYRVQAIGLERGAIGTPIAKYPEGTSDAKQTELQAFVTGLLAYEESGGTFPEGVTLENFSVDIKTEDIMAAIQHHDTKLAQCVLAQWLTLGQEGSGGAYALSADQTDLFLLSLEAVADYVAARFNRTVVREIVDYNIGTDQYPTLSATISRQSASQLAGLIRPLVAGTNAPVSWGEADEDWLRERLQLPARTEPRPKRTEVVPPTPAKGKDKEPKPGQELRRQRIELRVFADPPQFREEPAYEALGIVIGQFKASIDERLEQLQAKVWRIARLPDVQALSQTFKAFPELTPAQSEALDKAISGFITDFAGDDQTPEGFVGTDSEDALLQGYLRLGHAVGAEHARVGTAAFKPTRESPEIRQLLENSFARLSHDGRLRLNDQLAGIREILVDAAVDGRSPFDVATELSARFDQYSSYEFERLARTEMAFAANQGSVDEYRAQGLDQLQVLVSGLACSICTAHTDAILGVGEVSLGENAPPFHPNCLCALSAYFEEPPNA